MQTDQAAFLLNEVFLPSLKSEQRTTKGVIAAIPANKGDFRPDEISKSALDLAWHIVVTEIRFIDAVLDGKFDFTPRPRPDDVTNAAQLIDWYESAFTEHIEKLAALTPDQLTQSVDFRGMMQMPAVNYVGFVIRHSVHHRGQLSMYLRPMGAKVPAIYGESYDSAEARKAAQKA